jgi:hypothetical protein
MPWEDQSGGQRSLYGGNLCVRVMVSAHWRLPRPRDNPSTVTLPLGSPHGAPILNCQALQLLCSGEVVEASPGV